MGWLQTIPISYLSMPMFMENGDTPDGSARLPHWWLDEVPIVILRLGDVKYGKDGSDTQEYGGIGQDTAWTDPVVERGKLARSSLIWRFRPHRFIEAVERREGSRGLTCVQSQSRPVADRVEDWVLGTAQV